MGGIIIPIKNWRDLTKYVQIHGGNFFIEVAPSKRRYNITWLNGCLITYDISKRLAKKLIKLGIESTGIVDNKDKIPQSCLNVQKNNQRIGAKLFANKLSELFCPECDYGGANIRETITALLKKMYGGDNNGK